MTTYMIGYDLSLPGQSYEPLHKEIKRLGDCWHCLDSTWIVNTTLKSEQIRDRLLPYIDKNDSILVSLISRDAAWSGFNPACSDWLRNNL